MGNNLFSDTKSSARKVALINISLNGKMISFSDAIVLPDCRSSLIVVEFLSDFDGSSEHPNYMSFIENDHRVSPQ